jgi:hypothetical protein
MDMDLDIKAYFERLVADDKSRDHIDRAAAVEAYVRLVDFIATHRRQGTAPDVRKDI